MALANYDDVFGHLPASYTTDTNDEPASSWRFALIFYYERGSYYDPPPEPELRWTDPANARWITLPYDFLCFSPNSCMTNVVAVTGRGTVFDPGCQHKLAELQGDTVLIVEVRDFGVHWMQPGDLHIGDLVSSGDSAGVGDRFGTTAGSFIVGFTDRQAWALRKDMPLDELKKFLTIDGARQYDRNEALRPYRLTW